MIPLHAPHISKKDIKKVSETLKSGWVSTSGKVITEFEKKIAHYVGSKYCVAVSSGTSALHLALRVAGVKINEEVIVPTISFIAPINAVNYNSAIPVFMDSDDNLNIDETKVIKFINNETYFYNNQTYNKNTKK